VAVKTISIDELDQFGVDTETNELYWRGRRVRTEMVLPGWVKPSAFIISLATAIQAANVVVHWLK
jgi:hypothetical protein